MTKLTNAIIDRAIDSALGTDKAIENTRHLFAPIKEAYDAVKDTDKVQANVIRRDVQVRYAAKAAKKDYDAAMEQYKLKGDEQAEWFVKAYGAARTAWSRYVNYTKSGGGATAKAAQDPTLKAITKGLAHAKPAQVKKVLAFMRELGLIE